MAPYTDPPSDHPQAGSGEDPGELLDQVLQPLLLDF